ncbi:uncharacterized protein LOC131330254 [Rhododendron vialii]|uniref:uncharacterized protein LOC131330254 n=1 Tax=Rhododendron vialii TaxID=182163 RepID=UPI00265D942E|nr:uncharacterized protein LOC131330254 [Rhododendron vialii]
MLSPNNLKDVLCRNPHIDMEVICCAPKEVMVYYLFTMVCLCVRLIHYERNCLQLFVLTSCLLSVQGIFEETVQKPETMERDRNMDICHAFKRQKDVDDEWLVRAIRAGSDLCHSEESTIANADFNVDKVSGGEAAENQI